MRELVQAIDLHAKLVHLEITNDPNSIQNAIQQFPTDQPPVNVDLTQPDQPQDPIV